MTLRILDLFCGAGGCSVGYHQGFTAAGLDVGIVGVDHRPQPNYPYEFVQADATTFPLDGFDLVHASPPCQHYSMYARNMGTSDGHPDLLGCTRERLERGSTPYIVENVPGAPLRIDVALCGCMFGLRVRRRRIFELGGLPPMLVSPCYHTGYAVPVYGHGTPQWYRKVLGRNISVDERREAMGIDWMNRGELSEAIPPAYTRFLAEQIAPMLAKEAA